MKILAFSGSPRAAGNGEKIISSILSMAERNGHTARMVRLYEQSIKPCMGCETCKTKGEGSCIHKDSFAELVPELIEADCIIIGSPVYFGQISGVTKLFMDRWHTFFDNDFNVKHVNGKKLILVTTCAASPERWSSVADYMVRWFGGFFQMNIAGRIEAGNLVKESDILSQREILKKAEELGSSL